LQKVKKTVYKNILLLTLNITELGLAYKWEKVQWSLVHTYFGYQWSWIGAAHAVSLLNNHSFCVTSK